MANNNRIAFSGKIECTKSILGKGGFGIVYRGRYEDCDVAVKKIQLDSFEDDDREIRIQNGLDHENVLKILTVEDNDDFRFIVLELCAGTLEHVCCQKYRGPDLSPDDQVLYQIANGLEYIHSKKFVHRDIKPENILISLTKPVRIKLSDFGLSKEISTMNTCSMSGFKGTKLWMAPELLKMHNSNSILTNELKLTYSTSSDIFSTGCVFFFFITRGTHLFGDVHYVLPNILNNERKNLNILLNQNHFASDIVHGMTLHEPKSRLTIQNVLDMLRLEAGPSEIAPISDSVQFVLRTRQCKNLKETDDLVMRYRFHPVHPILAVGLKTGRVFLIESESHDDSFPNWKTETQLQSSTSATLYSLDWNVDGTLLAAGYSNQTVIVWRYPGGHVIFRGAMGGVEKIFWSPFMSELFVFCIHHQQGSNKKGIISSWLSSEQRVQAQTFTINCYIWDIVWLSFSSFAAGCDDGIIRVYQLGVEKNKSLVLELHHGGKIRNLDYNPALELLASCSYEGTVKVWSIGDHTPITKLDVNSQCHCLCWHPLSNWQTKKSSTNYSIACGLRNGSIILWDHLNVEKTTMTLKTKHSRRIRDVSYSPDGRFLASIGNDDQIIIWSSKDWSTIGLFDMKNCLLLERKILWNSTSQKLTISSRRCQIPMIEYVK